MMGRWAGTSHASVSERPPSTIVTLRRPMISMTWSGPTTPAVSSSMPMPSRAGFWAMIESRRPSRLRCWKCWSTMTSGRTPRPAASWAMRCRGDAPLAPKATMWVLIAEAPALVPAITAPAAWRSWMMWAIKVPPIVELRRSWLPPVRKMPVASRRAWALASSLASARVTVWMGRTWWQPISAEDALVQLAGRRPER